MLIVIWWWKLTIQIQHNSAHIYDNSGKHLISIPICRLIWLWNQYQNGLNTPQNLEPQTQPYETEVVWLYQRYKYKIPKTDPLKPFHYTTPIEILNFITKEFGITQSYLSSPVTCPTNIQKYLSPFSRDKIFGSPRKVFDHRWKGIGYAHPHTKDDAQKAIHWARLAANDNPANVTFIIHPKTKWYQNPNPHTSPFLDTHIISIFGADTITYTEPTKPPISQTTNKEEIPRKELATLQLLCIHHQNNDIGTQTTLDQLTQIAKTLNTTIYKADPAHPTAYNSQQ